MVCVYVCLCVCVSMNVSVCLCLYVLRVSSSGQRVFKNDPDVSIDLLDLCGHWSSPMSSAGHAIDFVYKHRLSAHTHKVSLKNTKGNKSASHVCRSLLIVYVSSQVDPWSRGTKPKSRVRSL